jgi:threonine dehydrogenase-like Zn-dependent dehydrogenase
MGMLIGLVLSGEGVTVTMLGRSDSSLQLAREMGLPAALVESCEDDHFDMVVEATGNEAGLAQALRIVRPLGTLVMKSTFAGTARINLTKLVVGEITVIGSRCGPFADALKLLADDAVQVTPLIDAVYPLGQALSAFTHAAQPGVRKVLLRP